MDNTCDICNKVIRNKYALDIHKYKHNFDSFIQNGANIIKNNIEISQEDKLNILNSINENILPLVKMTSIIYNNDNYLQYRYVAIFALNGTYSLQFEHKVKKYYTYCKRDIINDMIKNYINNIEIYLSEISFLLDEETIEKVKNYIHYINNPDTTFKKILKEHYGDINLEIYNSKDKMRHIVDYFNK